MIKNDEKNVKRANLLPSIFFMGRVFALEKIEEKQ